MTYESLCAFGPYDLDPIICFYKLSGILVLWFDLLRVMCFEERVRESSSSQLLVLENRDHVVALLSKRLVIVVHL